MRVHTTVQVRLAPAGNKHELAQAKRHANAL
jgi:hypothetical protein